MWSQTPDRVCLYRGYSRVTSIEAHRYRVWRHTGLVPEFSAENESTCIEAYSEPLSPYRDIAITKERGSLGRSAKGPSQKSKCSKSPGSLVDNHTAAYRPQVTKVR